MASIALLPLVLAALVPLQAGAAEPSAPALGPWRAWLVSPGGELPFGLELARGADGAWSATIANGSERLAIPRVRFTPLEKGSPPAAGAGELELALPHYDARLVARVEADGRSLEGEYTKRVGPERWRRMPFAARAGAEPRFPAGADADAARASVAGRWRLAFDSSEEPAVGLFEQDDEGGVSGTILTTTGDYRYLAGRIDGARLRLSVFDGAHAFLFDATLDAEGKLVGDFWSGDAWHEGFHGERDDAARLADAFDETRWQPLDSLADVVVSDLEGAPRSLADPSLRGAVTLIALLGSWCPNCNDEAPYLAELQERYGPRGLRVVGLGFELTGERGRDCEQLARLSERFHLPYPLLYAGTADKAEAAMAFPGLDAVRSFPTTLFVDRAGRVRYVHSGYSGPATGDAYAEQRAAFEARIEELLADTDRGDAELRHALEVSAWAGVDGWKKTTFVFTRDPDGRLHAHASGRDARPGAPENAAAETFDARTVGADALWIGARVLRLDPLAQAFLDPTDFGARLMAANQLDSPLLAEHGYANALVYEQALQDPDARVRREAVWALGRRRATAAGAPAAPFLALLDDPEVQVVAAAVWGAGVTLDEAAIAPLLERRAHPNAGVRREVARALARFTRGRPALAAELAPMAEDLDPIVRALATLTER